MRIKLENKAFSIYIESSNVAAVADVLGPNGAPLVGSATIMLVGGGGIVVPMTKDAVAEAVWPNAAGGKCCGACKAGSSLGLVP